MATIVLGTIGGLAGAPFGAAGIGFSVGTLLGSMIDQSMTRLPGQGRLSDSPSLSSTYGQTIPQVYGAFRLGGIIIWSTPLVERAHRKKLGFLGPSETTFSYTASFAVLVCRGPVTRIKRIWAEDHTIYDVDATPITGYTIRVYTGTDDQDPDPIIIATEGTANAPGYRGRCYVVFENLDLSPWGNRFPNLSFEVEVWGELTALVSDTFTRADGNIGVAESGQTWQQAGTNAQITSNKCRSTAGTQAYIDVGLADVAIQLTMGNRDVVNGSTRCIGRFTDTNNYLYFGENATSGKYELVRKQAGLFTTITATLQTPVSGDVLKFILNGASLQGWINGVQIVSGSESFQQTATKHGFGSPEDFSTADDFTITPLEATTITVAQILADQFGQCGFTAGQYDVTAATDTVDGFILVDLQPCRDAIEGLLRVYQTLLTETGDQILAVKRGESAVLTVTEGDLGARLAGSAAEAVGKVEVKRLHELELPVRVEISYFSGTRRYTESSQGAQRYGKPALQDVLSLRVPLVFTADLTDSGETKARRVAEQLLWDIWVSRQQFVFSLPPAYLQLIPGDVINLPAGESLFRVRVVRLDLSLPGPVGFTAVLDDAATLTQVAPGGTVLAPAEEDADVVDTTLVAWAGEALTNEDAEAVGAYLAASGATEGFWNGGIAYWSRDSGASYQQLAVLPEPASLGTTSTVLAAGTTTGLFDDVNTVDILLTAGDPPTSTSDADLYSGANLALVGPEYLQYGTVTALGGDSYRLSHLLRGRRGSDGHWSEHITGERFVILEPGPVVRVEMGEDLKNKTVLLKALSGNQALGDVSPVSLRISGEELKPYAPVSITASRDGPLNITFAWLRRDRMFHGWTDLVDEPMSEATESYFCDVLLGTTKTITAISQATPLVITSAAHGFSAGQVVFIAGVKGMTELNGTVQTILSVTTNTVTIDLSSADFQAYVSGGTLERVVRSISSATPSAVYSAVNQVSDFGSTQSSVHVAIAQVGKWGRGWPGMATV